MTRPDPEGRDPEGRRWARATTIVNGTLALVGLISIIVIPRLGDCTKSLVAFLAVLLAFAAAGTVLTVRACIAML